MPWRSLLLGLLGASAAVLVNVFVLGIAPPFPDGFWDGDVPMRLLRVLDLASHGRWYDAAQAQTNAPYGETLHWTRPLDALLLPGALIGRALGDMRGGLLAWGWFLSPALLLASVPLWLWGWHRIMPAGPTLLFWLCLPLLAGANLVFLPGRPDHHGLLALLFIGQLGCLVRAASGGDGRSAALAGGLLSGLAMWVSVEGMVATAMTAAGLAGLWVGGHGVRGRDVAGFALVLAATLALALAAERPPEQWTLAAYARLSVAHVAVAGIAAVFSLGLLFGDARLSRPAARLAALAVLGVAWLVAVRLLLPDFLRGPLVDFDPRIIRAWLRIIGEFGQLDLGTLPGLAHALLFIAPAVMAAPRLFKHAFRRDGAERAVAAVLLLAIGVYLPLALLEVRWASYLGLAAGPAWLLAVDAALRRRNGALVGMAILLAPFLPYVASELTKPLPARAEAGAGCDWPAMTAHLAGEGRPRASGILLTDMMRGPGLVWATPWRVVLAPYGNSQPFNDALAFFGADEAAAERVAARRGLEAVLLCRDSAERRFHIEVGGSAAMWDRLAREQAPPWLRRQALPPQLSRQFVLYRVDRP